MKNPYLIILGLAVLLTVTSCPFPESSEVTDLINSVTNVDYSQKSTQWTILCYMDGDNDLESYLLDDVYEMSQGLEATELINVIVLFDRIPNYSSDSSILGADFTDTRLYRVGANDIYALDGKEYFSDIGMELEGEYNMGDANTLKSFIEYGKEYYPAENYGLIFSNHGSGVKSYSGDSLGSLVKGGNGLAPEQELSLDRAIAYDESSDDDAIYTAELTDVLDSSHSVDLLVYDACLMGLVEIAYQYRPVSAGGDGGEFSAGYMVASAPNVWGYGYPYDLVFGRISTTTAYLGTDSTVTGSSADMYEYAPEDLTPELLGRIFVEEQKIDTFGGNDQSLALYDLSEVGNVVTALDAVAVDLSGGTEGTLDDIRSGLIDYSSDSIGSPHYDLNEFAQSSEYTSASQSDLETAVNAMVLASFGDETEYPGFDEGTDGLGFFFPDGDAEYKDSPYWSYQWWYTGVDVNSWWSGHYYGLLDFCHANGDGNVDGYFEMLQSFYNTPYNENSHPGEW